MNSKLIVCIRSPRQAHERRGAIKETWGKDFADHGCEFLFIIANDSPSTTYIQKEDTLFTPGTDQHGDLSNRMIWLWRFLIKERDFSHVLVMDDDCSVNVDLLMSADWINADAWGCNNGGYLSGCGAIYSKKIIEKLNYSMCRDDLVIGSFLTRWNTPISSSGTLVRPWPSKDSDGNEIPVIPDDCAIQHYTRTPEQIRANHKISLTLNKK